MALPTFAAASTRMVSMTSSQGGPRSDLRVIVIFEGSTRGSGVLWNGGKELVERFAYVGCCGAPADVVLVGD